MVWAWKSPLYPSYVISFGGYIVWAPYRLGVRRTGGRSTHPDNRLALLPWPIQDFVIGKRHGAPSSRHVIPGARMIDSPVTPTSSCRRRPVSTTYLGCDKGKSWIPAGACPCEGRGRHD